MGAGLGTSIGAGAGLAATGGAGFGLTVFLPPQAARQTQQNIMNKSFVFMLILKVNSKN